MLVIYIYLQVDDFLKIINSPCLLFPFLSRLITKRSNPDRDVSEPSSEPAVEVSVCYFVGHVKAVLQENLQ